MVTHGEQLLFQSRFARHQDVQVKAPHLAQLCRAVLRTVKK
jgi:hypothetical protein